MENVIYLDHNATTPVNEAVLQSMLPYFSTNFGNASNPMHAQAWSSAGAVRHSRKIIAQLFGCEPSEIVFTSGATESIHLALYGLTTDSKIRTIFTSNAEHSATSAYCGSLEKKSIQINYLNVEKNGLIDFNKNLIESSELKKEKILSLILANNEIGSLYNLEELIDYKNKNNFILHLDATQALLTQDFNPYIKDIDLMSFSGHKIYGPKGIGGLYLNKKTIGHQLSPLFHGGGQEFGLRSGTLNTPGIVGLGKACELILESREFDRKNFYELHHYFLQKMRDNKIIFLLNGDPEARIFNNINITLEPVNQAQNILQDLPDFCLSQGSACGSGQTSISPVLKSIGLNEKSAQNTLRIGLGRDTQKKYLEKLVEKLANLV